MSVSYDQYRLLYEGSNIVEHIRSYLLSVVAAAMICSIISVLTPKDSAYGAIVKMICGLFIAITAISPLLDFQVMDSVAFWDDLHTDAGVIIDRGEEMANRASCEIIKSQSEAYILDKASSLGLTVKVEVTLTDSVPPSPYSIKINGAVSPYQKQFLQQLIQNEMAIPEERQTWN